jgi:crotonobetainyl-CoA:carnitine CoA-transferase CaiB-like acyl-CoA transferase
MTKRPLEGLRVADFSWFGAGPIAANTLSQFGAEVIRVESEAKLDGLRVGAPTPLNPDGTPKAGYNMSGYFNNFNTGKLSMQLNLNTEKGQEIGYRLIEKSDFFLTNFTPRVIEKWNLTYPQISRVNPRIIAGYAPMQGMAGPHRDFLGFGAVLTPVTGISEMSGFPNRTPFGIGTNYPDYVINPGHTITAMLAALRYRNRTGKGQCVELPQIESVVNILGTAVAEAVVNHTNPSRTGNRSVSASPHGAFRCADDPESVGSPDRWVVIACRTDSEWAAAASALGHPEALTDSRFASFAARKQNEDALEETIAAWVRERPAVEVCEALQAAHVPAGIVQNAQDMLDRDLHMKARGYYQYVDHPEAGREAHDGPAAVLSETPGSVPGPAPLLGEHTMDVCERILGLTMDEVADLLAEGVLI